MTAIFEDHLTVDAVVAFTDGEMSMVAYQRAAAHLARCPHCAAEVNEQAAAREFLRSAGAPRMPGSLLDALRSIPVAGPGALATSPLQARAPVEGRPGHRGVRGRRFRLGAGALVAGLSLGMTAGAASDAPHEPLPDAHTALPTAAPVTPPGRS